MAQNLKLEDMCLGIIGVGKVNDNIPIDLKEYAYPKDYHSYAGMPVRVLPRRTEFSMKIGGTQFGVTTHFNTDGRESVLQQFEELILAKKLV